MQWKIVQGGNKSFVKSFSKSQKSGLKELTKKLDKADSEVTKQKKALDQRLGLPQGNDEGVASMADKLEKALTDFQAQQLSLGKEMGIQVPAIVKSERTVWSRATCPRGNAPDTQVRI